MSYGTPALEHESRTYKVILNHQTISGSGDLVCTLSFSNIADEADTDQCVQDFVDLVDGSADFLIAVATKATPSLQTISPT